jgi:hypothetical protein
LRSSQRELIPCIWGADLVVVARFRAAAMLRLWRVCAGAGPDGSGIVAVM